VPLLLDTNVVIPLVEGRIDALPAPISAALRATERDISVSVVSLWEMAIKVRLGKLPLKAALSDLPQAIERGGMALLAIEAPHALAEIDPTPETRDPFDRMLLAQCQVEDMRLVTRDRALAAHPLAWQPG
jgi:PIN domain nuclease of toxin-antitoxin system